MWATLLAALLRTLSGITDWASSINASFFILCLILTSVIGLFTSFLPDVDHDANAVALLVTQLTAIYAMMAVLVFSRSFFKHPWVPQTIRGAILAALVFCSFISGLSLRVFSYPPLDSVACDGHTLCENPCSSIPKSKYRGISENMLPVIWSPSDPNILGRLASENDWAKTANLRDVDGYNFFVSLQYWYWMLGLVFYTASKAVSIPAREARNIVFQSVQESVRPRYMNDLSLKSHLGWAATKARYMLLVMEVFILPIQLGAELLVLCLRCLGRRRPRNAQSQYISTVHDIPAFYYIGIVLAVVWYAWALLLQALLPVSAVYLIIKSEMSFKWIPNLEEQQPFSFKVPLLYIISTTLIAMISGIHKKWRSRRAAKQSLKIAQAGYRPGDAESLLHTENELSQDDLPLHKYIVACVLNEYRDFSNWCKDPRKASRHQSGVWGKDMESKDIQDWTIPEDDVARSSSPSRALRKKVSVKAHEDLERQQGFSPGGSYQLNTSSMDLKS